MKPSATIRSSPQDFQVDEIPLYAPAGSGGHVFVQVRKTGWSTDACARRIASALGMDKREIGHAGMKDRHAVTTQWLSFPWPEGEALPNLDSLAAESIEVLAAVRHPHKLRVGHLRGNHFTIVLRDLGTPQLDWMEVMSRWSGQGIPNRFGPQRFGRDGDNPQRALDWLRGRNRGPRDKRTRRLVISSVQSLLFDRLLDRRVADGTWDTVVAGDLVKTRDRGGLFLSEDGAWDAKRAARAEVSATGPMFGPRMRWPEGLPAQWEAEIVEEALGGRDALDGMGKMGAGTRRALRIIPENLKFVPSGEHSDASVTICMTLPKGAYATTVIGELFSVRDASISRPSASNEGTSPDSSGHDELLRDTRSTSR